MSPQKCEALTAKGTPCRAWAIPNKRPARCSAHRETTKDHGAPTGNKNAQTHGAYSSSEPPANLDEAIADLQRRLHQLSDYIDSRLLEFIDADTFIKLAALQGQLTSRLGRLMRDRSTLGGGENSELSAAVNLALDEISDELGIEL